jgi:hypothetical protein
MMHGHVNIKKREIYLPHVSCAATTFKTLSAFVESTRNLVSFQQMSLADDSDLLLMLHLLITFDLVMML